MLTYIKYSFAVMAEVDFTLIHKRATPVIQAIASVVIGWGGMTICHLLQKISGEDFFAALIALIFYTIINTVISITYKSYLRYTIPSYYLYVLVVIILFLSAKWLTGISIWNVEMKEYRMMLISITLFYFVISNLVRVVRAIYNAIEREM
ncbi:MAG: hypothetical protein IPP77_01115 [Bacteroidetes bacterium]|nr:hypothetical protein [Bacteroidota bacterium]